MSLLAAIYVRKSTDQQGVAEDQKSVARQIDHARQYAVRKGWTVGEEHIYVDDGISGAEFANRPGFLRLMNTLKPRARFQALIMSEESRLGREAIETAYALKQLVQAGVRVFFYLEDRERTLDSPTDKIMLSLTAFADELEREKARQRTYDAMQRKAKVGHVCGGRVFGYDNIDIVGPDGRRSHVTRQINQSEAAIVRRIFELSAKGVGLTSIAKTLNAEAAPSPRAQQGRPRAWAPSTVRELLYRTLYRGEITWNRSRKRNPWGQVQRQERPQAEWFSISAPELRIISDKLWQQVHERLDQQRTAYLRGTNGQLWGRPARGVESKYLLPGLARCGGCGGSMYVKSRQHGKKRACFYGCTSFHLRGSSVCSNSLEVPMPASDLAVLKAIETDILQPEVITATLRKTLERLKPAAATARARRELVDGQITEVKGQLDRLMVAVAAGGELPVLLQGIKERQDRLDRLTRELTTADQQVKVSQLQWSTVERQIMEKLQDWKGLLQRHTPQARQILKKLLYGPIVFTAQGQGKSRHYTFKLKLTLDHFFEGTVGANALRVASANMVASPTGFDTAWSVNSRRILRAA
jgi:site-specific DNA recombinase